mmetsp:Transcript_17395/g.49049  ORF Transcript_17395/g.49049 Transcript_17395/m.49049 type:complete len:172 (+) Transcript_17395:179-694(+)|eukprot:CAMPEP_0119558338 /NCGR_PEP_ID=MMETSP1352-20130426/10635_1 /TAXON_ID=265584 /ORGANISM="Stauroneis constricta, Strain CCMP1120" /LENGTH=171 /DNA_ID=CAMNT_0007605661 /DNA_START=98 /DNA_END=613 /DNA_ORIENTATION=+
MAELMFGLGQTKKKKETAAKVRQTKAEEWNYKGRIDQDGTFLERKAKNQESLSYKEKQRETKKNLKDVTQGEDGEMALRKQQFNRDQKWKETKRDQVKKNTNFDMARSLFGGGGPAPAAAQDDEEEEYEEEEEEEEEVVEEEDDDDDDDDDDSVEVSDEEVEEEEVESDSD